jgi:hypothetical protein
MFNLRCTARLLSQLKAAAEEPAEATTRLGDWYGNLFAWRRKQWAMFTSERSLLTVILPANEIRPLPNALAASVRQVLVGLHVSSKLIDDELSQMQSCVLARTANRSVLGSMTDFIFAARMSWGESPPLPLMELNLRLAETPMKSIDYRYPGEVAVELLAAVD